MDNGENEKVLIRYGIAELFGRLVDEIPNKERKDLLEIALHGKVKEYPECPFRLPLKNEEKRCSKKGGVCSIRKYINQQNKAIRLNGWEGSLTVTCPLRFHQNLEIFHWIGETILETENIILVKEVGFLEAPFDSDNANRDEENVGRIDMILVNNDTITHKHMEWCAIEIQAVYFSGPSMKNEFININTFSGSGIPFPDKIRRPDYRSSAPKRLMPQLQIKVPALRRWGKKMAVVVDRHFFEWMGKMELSRDLTSSDIVWFVVDFIEKTGIPEAKISRYGVYYTTLERAVESLTGGLPVSLQVFENRIKTNTINGIKINNGKLD